MHRLAKPMWLALGLAGTLAAQAQMCPARLAPGSDIPDPPMVHARNGVIGGAFYAYFDGDPSAGRDGRYCLMYSGEGTPVPLEAPVLRLAPGDGLNLQLVNRMPDTPAMATHPWNPALNPPGSGTSACSPQAEMKDYAVNLHFHGTNVPPVCGSDEVITTMAQPGGPAWRYQFRLPLNAPPGLDWYHPHIHGLTQEQMLGGMTGALIIEAPNQMPNVVAGLRERVLVLRDQDLAPPPAGVRYVERPDVIDNLAAPLDQRTLFDAGGQPAPDVLLKTLLAGGTAVTSDPGAPGTAPQPTVVPPWKDISVNQVQVRFTPGASGVAAYSAPGVIRMEGQSEFWRVANVSADSYLRLQVRVKAGAAAVPQVLRVVAMDGVPISAPNGQLLFDDNSLVPVGAASARPHKTVRVQQVLLPPGGRVEFIVDAPAAGQTAELVSLPYETNADANPFRVLASVRAPAPGTVASASRLMRPPTASEPRRRFVDKGTLTPPARPDHLLYFSQNDTAFFITEDASTSQASPPPVETAYSMQSGPSIYVPNGAIQTWKIENRAPEAHAFHMHQIRFRVLGRYPAPEASAELFDAFALRDTVDLPAYTGTGQPPSVTLRVYFNEPDIRGNFVYHCHILEHEDKGMMGIVRVVDPAAMPVASAPRGPRRAALAQAGRSAPARSVASRATGREAPALPQVTPVALTAGTPGEARPQMRDRFGRLIDPQVCTTPAAARPPALRQLL